MKVAISHLGNASQLIPASSVLRGIKNQEIPIDITMIVQEEFLYLFRHNKDIYRAITLEQFTKEARIYDLFINLYPFFPENLYVNSEIRQATGFYFCKEYDKFKEALMGEKEYPNMSILQLYFILAGLKWKGEGYDLGYYPKTKKKKNRIGISVANANVRNYVLDNLEIDNKKIWYVPYKKNVFKKMDEINKCDKIITDDLISFHLAMSLRKYVYYLETFPLSMRLEMFHNGETCKVPMNIF